MADLESHWSDRRRVIAGVMIERRRWWRVPYPVFHRVISLNRAAAMFYDAVSPTIYGDWIRQWRQGRKRRVKMAKAFVVTNCDVWGRFDADKLWRASRDTRPLSRPVVLLADLRRAINMHIERSSSCVTKWDRIVVQPTDLRGTPQWTP